MNGTQHKYMLSIGSLNAEKRQCRPKDLNKELCDRRYVNGQTTAKSQSPHVVVKSKGEQEEK